MGGSNCIFPADCILLCQVGFMPRVSQTFYPFQFFFFSFFNSVEIALQLVSGFFSGIVLYVAVDCVHGKRPVHFT